MALVVGTVLGCAPKAAPAPEPAPDRPTVPSDHLAPLGVETGQVIAVTVPLHDGRELALADLRGRKVALLFHASFKEGFTGDMHDAERWAGPAGERAVVLISLDPDPGVLSEVWGDVPADGVYRGWDPQGALAAQLQVAKLPTAVVLDERGAMVAVWGGLARNQWPEVEAALGP